MKLNGLKKTYKDGVTIDLIVENLQNEITIQENKIKKHNRKIEKFLKLKDEYSEQKRNLKDEYRFYKNVVGDSIKAEEVDKKFIEVCEIKEKILSQLYFENKKVHSRTKVIEVLTKHITAITGEEI